MMQQEHFNQRAATWDEMVAEKDAARLEDMSRRLAIAPGSAVLDIGTGTGVFIPYLLDKVGSGGRIVSLDFARQMLAVARAKGFGGNIDYLCADVCRIPLGDGCFDSIVCYSSFPHFRDKARALAEMSRVLKKGGGLFICHTSSRARINRVHRQIPAVRDDLIPGTAAVQALLEAAGFGEIEIDDASRSYLAGARKV